MSATDQSRPVRVLLVEDSQVNREFLTRLLEADPKIRVVGYVADGAEALDAARRLRPDLIAMDFHMPLMNGFEATRAIMENHPTPIVIFSGSPGRVASTWAFRLLDAGALAVLEKPPAFGHPGHEAAVQELRQAVRLMAEVKVVRRWPRREAAAAARPIERAAAPGEVEAVAIGASAGGPVVLRTILAGVPKAFSVPVLIVQHIAEGFTEGLVDWLAQSTGFAVHMAKDGEQPMPGHAYVAPDRFHLVLEHDRRLALRKGPPQNGHRPSVSRLFLSVAEVLGRRAVGVLLTGMGRDGASELKLMRDRGATTIVQSLESSTIPGMPGAAMELQAAKLVLAPAQIAVALTELAAGRSPHPARHS